MLLAVLLIGCNNSKDENELLKFENILFENKTFEYDEKLKKLEVTGLPTGASVEYETNEAVDVGTYNAKAIVSKKGYETLTLTATLTITEGNLKGITFDDEVFAYDGTVKKLEVKGLPEGANVKYESNQATEIGLYQATATINKKGYKTLVLTANLNIIEVEFINVKFEDVTHVYDGTLKKIEVSGLPEGAVVEYESNQSIAVGVYNATAFIKKEGYKTLTLAATLTITPANFTGVILKDKEYI
ncbi:MAG: hypothetical protein GX794_03455, partial [Acholeplasmataceae bacterium]|nr:hypothetical protein [Acholeplasmataceae bacterium]